MFQKYTQKLYYNCKLLMQEPQGQFQQASYPAQTFEPCFMNYDDYSNWYQSLPSEQKAVTYNPQQYYQWMTYYNFMFTHDYRNDGFGAIKFIQHKPQTFNYGYIPMNPSYTMSNVPEKSSKLSRNQKRKLKKKQLQEEYEKEKKQIGKWVDLQRKDLVEGIKKIQEQQQKIKAKRKQKLSHLIEIHKEVYKHMMKKNKGKVVGKQKAGNFRRKKKKLSHIKKMKELYEQMKKNQQEKGQKIQQLKEEHTKVESNNQSNQQDYITQSQSQDQSQIKTNPVQYEQNPIQNQTNKEKTQNNQDEKQSHSNMASSQKPEQAKEKVCQQKEIKEISYKSVGKLTGYVYNGITLREWVDHVPSAKLQDLVLRFINRLAYKQAIKKVNQPEKARKLIIAGLHECRRTLWTKLDKKKSKLLIVALNIERNNLARGTDDQLQQVLAQAHEANVPIIHISTRSKIGRAFTGKFGPRITIVSVINCEGYQDYMDAITQQWRQMKKVYQETSLQCFNF